MPKLATFLLTFLLLATISISAQIPPGYNYDTFCAQYGRNYTGEERDQHKAIFDANLIEIKKRIDDGQDLKVNRFMDWNQTQKKGILNFNQNNANRPPSATVPKGLKVASTSAKFNWKDEDVVTSVKDQGNCGSCWAFSATAGFESMIAIEQKVKYDLAEQYPFQCDTVASYGCWGGQMYTAQKLMVANGMPEQSVYPYQPYSYYYYYNGYPICEAKNNTIKLKSKVIEFAVLWNQNLTVEFIQNELVTYGPLVVGIDGSSYSFQYAGSSGLINNCYSYPDINHGVLLYGYNETHWFIKNSWGTSWGDNGFGYVLKTNDCGIKQELDLIRVDWRTPVMVNLTVTMQDSAGDGWNGYELGLRQVGQIIGTFGEGSYASSGSKQASSSVIQIDDYYQTDVVLVKKGTHSEQIGFKVVHQNGTVLYQRKPGRAFGSDAIFKSFCLTGQCPTYTSQYLVTLYDSFGDGWGATEFVAKFDNGTNITLPVPSTNFSSYSFTADIPDYQSVSIVATKVDNWTDEIGFTVTNKEGKLLAARMPGNLIFAGDVLGSVCTGCANVLESTPQNNQTQANGTAVTYVTVEPENYKAYQISTYVLAGVAALFLGALLFVVVKLVKTTKNYQQLKSEKLLKEEKSSGPKTTNIGSENVIAASSLSYPLVSANPPPQTGAANLNNSVSCSNLMKESQHQQSETSKPITSYSQLPAFSGDVPPLPQPLATSQPPIDPNQQTGFFAEVKRSFGLM